MDRLLTAKFLISDVSKITGRGFALLGCILEGEISVGDVVEFAAFNEVFNEKINSVEDVRTTDPEKVNIGLLIKTVNSSTIEKLSNMKFHNELALIFKS